MKRIIIVLAGLVMFCSVAQAEQRDEMTDQKGMAPQNGAMRMICPMMDMMQSMLDMMKMQQKMIDGEKPVVKKEMMMQMDKKMGEMKGKMTDMQKMMQSCMPNAQGTDMPTTLPCQR
jgi:hypothetical protein